MKPVLVKNNLNKVTISVFVFLFFTLFLLLVLAFNRYVLGNESAVEEKLVKGNTFSLKNVSCDESTNDSCLKKVKVSYNGANHMVKIKSIKENVKNNFYNLKFDIYVDEKLIETLDAGVYKGNIFNNDFNGFVYIVDSKYLALVLPRVSGSALGYGLTFYNNYEGMGYDFSVKMPGHDVCKDASCTDVLNDLEDLYFDGSSFQYWNQSCEGSTTVKVSIKFDGVNVSEEIVDQFSGMHGTGNVC